MAKNYNDTINFINQAVSTLTYDPKANDVRTYLVLALGMLDQLNKNDSKNLTARKQMEALGKKKMEEWNKKIKENINKLKL